MQQVLPFVQVRDLPSSASFYSAITQPLKLRYISANSSSIVFGDTTSASPNPILEIRKVGAGQPLKPSRVVLSAPSPSVVSAFRAAALRADPDIPIDGDGGNHVEITDFDGNKIEVMYQPSSGYPANYGSSRTSTSGALTQRGPQTMIRRSHTTSTVESPPRDSSRGLSTGAGAGTGFGSILGAAAVGVAVGGALTYAMMRSDRERAPRQEYDAPLATMHRRASYPDPHPDLRPRYAEIEYPSSSPKKYPPPSYGARYSQIDSPSNSRALEDMDDRASRRSSHYGTGSRSRRLSEASTTRRPLMIADVEHMSNTSSRRDAGPRLLMDAEHRSRSRAPSQHTATPSKPMVEADYLSRASTVRHAPRADAVEKLPPSRSQSQAPSRHSTATATKSGRSRATSYVSARDMPLPESRVGWGEDNNNNDNDDDDAESLAPSDSISCVGSGSSKRTRRNSLAGGSIVGRYRKVVNEFDGRRRPLYGSEYH
ncbi:hypothetical protein F4677DRAFT_349845 [Hypoxylon crocopeplum]|nr:hypothetical protein F4677DRAFT_349845 [Hypoxylon crocopeplum]